MGILLALQGAVSQGLLWSILALGIYITFRLLSVSDLTADGSFALGGSFCATLIVIGVNPVISIFGAILLGALAGLITGLLTTKLKIPAILSGILTQLSLYSINLRIMGKSNTPLLKYPNIFKSFSEATNISMTNSTIIIGLIFVVLVIGIMYWFFGTEIGSAIRATGSNEKMVRAQGVDTDLLKIYGFMISNALIALSGSLVTQSLGYADVKMGIGSIVIGLASIIIGELLVRKTINFALRLSAVIFGSIAYRACVAIVLQLGLKTDDLKLFTAVLVAIALSSPVLLELKKGNRLK